jgi:hypothetical protein
MRKIAVIRKCSDEQKKYMLESIGFRWPGPVQISIRL